MSGQTPTKEQTEILSTAVPAHVAARVRALAAATERTTSAIVRIAVRAYLLAHDHRDGDLA